MIILYLFIILNQIMPILSLININIGATGLLIPYTIGALGYIKKNEQKVLYNLLSCSFSVS